MIIPPYLTKGDKVAIVCTARKLSVAELEPALNFLKNCGLIPVLGNTIGKGYHQFGGTDDERTADFQKMLDDEHIKAIWCARGGYGTVRIIDALDFSTFKKQPKWIIGYSDVTVLHSHIHNLNIATLHGQMCLELSNKTEATRTTLKKALFGAADAITYDTKDSLNRIGQASGALVGGNLSILHSLLGSPTSIKTNSKILFLEDLSEYLYHVDRMMYNLKRNGLLENLAGLVVGGLTTMQDNSIPFGKTVEQIIAEAVKDYDYPVCFQFPAGHDTDNRALILGIETQLKVTETSATLKSNP